MKKSNDTKKQVFSSMKEFEERFFPNSFKKQFLQVISNSRDIGIKLANESLTAIRQRINK